MGFIFLFNDIFPSFSLFLHALFFSSLSSLKGMSVVSGLHVCSSLCVIQSEFFDWLNERRLLASCRLCEERKSYYTGKMQINA